MKQGHQDGMPVVRWCVTNPCEMKKCERMAMEFNYKISPRMQWSCVMASCKESCMEEIQRGNADIMTAEGDEIYTAGKMHDLKPIMAEKEDHDHDTNYDKKFKKFEEQDGTLKHFSIALIKKSSTGIKSFQDLNQKKSCHPGVDSKAGFKSPVCSLIKKDVVPSVGNVFESAGEFFKESCLPGVQQDKFNPNMTNPESLCKLCKGQGDKDDEFCQILSEKEPYYGADGALKCLREGAGDVAFFHSHDIMLKYDTFSTEFDIVCETKKRPLTWDNLMKPDCHLTEEHPQVLMVNGKKSKKWIKACTDALMDASTKFKSPASGEFDMFDSIQYCAKDGSDDKRSEMKNGMFKVDMNLMKKKDLIFKDCSNSLVPIPEDKRTYEKFLGIEMVGVWKACEQLEPKPRAFICVVGDDQMSKCQDMITKFQTVDEVRKVSWGCIEAPSKQECVEMVADGLADLVDLNATEMFVAGMDFNLAPFVAENYKGKDPMTESITIGVMLKDSSDIPGDMQGLKMCNAGVDKLSGFLHPMGWLMANGTVPRRTTPLESIGKYFGESCVPGIDKFDLTRHPLLSRTLDWRGMLKDKIVRWEDWYNAPLWRQWQDKQDGKTDVYTAMHKIEDFQSPEFKVMIAKMGSLNPRMRKYHTPEIRQIPEKTDKDFKWENYKGLEDFYGLKMPEWKMIGWVWHKPEDWTEEQWVLFQMWAERSWNQKEDLASFVEKWTDMDWEIFKRWMDAEFQDYSTKDKFLHQDTFIRLSLMCSRYHWLLNEWKNLQYDDIDTKQCREKLCNTCAGKGDKKCSMDSNIEDYYGYKGALRCLKQRDGNVAFIDAYTFENIIQEDSYNNNDFVLLCPDGKTVDYTGADSYEKCNFGRIPSRALVTCNMHDGIWRWKVTKALLVAQTTLPRQVFQDCTFSKNMESFTSIPFVNQTYQVRLGPMFLRAMESLVQPPVKEKVMKYHIDDCLGEECDGDVEDRPACDECPESDDVCLKNCWDGEPIVMKEMPSQIIPEVPHRMPLKMVGGVKKIILWKPKCRHSRQMMGKMHMGAMEFGMKGPMNHHDDMRSMNGLMMGSRPGMRPEMHERWSMMRGKMFPHPKMSVGPTKFGMKFGAMMKPVSDKMYMMPPKMGMHPFKSMPKPFMDEPMHGGKMANHFMETGPLMHSHKSIRGEFYTNVLFARDGTCNSIVHDLSCFGEKRKIRMKAGRVGKTPITVSMCPRPITFKHTTALFTCDNGASFAKPVSLPLKCAYAPCKPGFSWLPDWSNDQYWLGDNKYTGGDHWGNKAWWKNRQENDNWFLTARDTNRIQKKGTLSKQ